MRPISTGDMALHGATAALLALIVAVLVRASAHPAWGWLGAPVAALYGWGALRRPLRRRRLDRLPFPQAWRETLLRNVRFYRGLGEEGRRRFERDVRYFIAEQRIEGVDGVSVTDEERVFVAAGAAVLLHGRPDWELPRRHTILLYPSSFDEQFHCRPRGPLDGEMHGQGPIIISVEALLQGWRSGGEAGNVALHEFAHLMEMRGGSSTGVPRTLKSSAAGPWLDLLRREMDRAERGRSLLRDYAATSEAECFAVAVECFFGQPLALRRRHPELYAALADLFNQDPAERQ